MQESEESRKTRTGLSQVADPMALLEGIFSHSPLALQIYDASGHSILTNDAFRKLFGAVPPPEYNVLEDDIARENGMLALIRRSFLGETVHLPVSWYDPRALRSVHVPQGNRVAIETTFFPLWAGEGVIGHVAVVFKDVTAEHAARAQAESERDLLRLVIAHGGDGVIVCDESGVLRIFNPAAERQHGVKQQDVAAPHWAQTYGLLQMDGTPLALEDTPLYRASKGETVDGARWRVRRPDASERVLNGTATPLRSSDGKLRGAVLITRDETDRLAEEKERASLLEREQAARAEAEAANRVKDDFLAMLGHELRNPLAPIVTALHLMKLRGGDALQKERTVIERQVAHLTRLVDDLLDVSRITRGKVELKKKRIEIAEVVAMAIEMSSPLLEQRKHHLSLSVPAHGLMVEGDVTRLAQVLSNLLTNSARYTEPGGHIEIAASREQELIVLTVRDDGIGIDSSMVPHVFDLFKQERQGIDRSSGGLGLGLSIVKSLVDLHDGKVSASSEGRGRGSVFTVALPASRRMGAPAPVGAMPAASDLSVRPRHVLLVDDNVDAAELLAEVLRRRGHIVEVAHDGPSALLLVDRFRPEIALLDIGLPVMDGYELARRLASQLGALRLIALTGYGQPVDRERAREAGFHAHLIKPVDHDELEAALN